MSLCLVSLCLACVVNILHGNYNANKCRDAVSDRLATWRGELLRSTAENRSGMHEGLVNVRVKSGTQLRLTKLAANTTAGYRRHVSRSHTLFAINLLLTVTLD